MRIDAYEAAGAENDQTTLPVRGHISGTQVACTGDIVKGSFISGGFPFADLGVVDDLEEFACAGGDNRHTVPANGEP